MLNYNDLIGKPFRRGARGPEFYDCWGICLELGRRVGIKLPEDFTPETSEAQDKAIRYRQDQDFVKLSGPEPFCIVTFRMTPAWVDHCGFVLEDRRHFIHILRQHSVARISLKNKIIERKIEGYYRCVL